MTPLLGWAVFPPPSTRTALLDQYRELPRGSKSVHTPYLPLTRAPLHTHHEILSEARLAHMVHAAVELCAVTQRLTVDIERPRTVGTAIESRIRPAEPLRALGRGLAAIMQDAMGVSPVANEPALRLCDNAGHGPTWIGREVPAMLVEEIQLTLFTGLGDDMRATWVASFVLGQPQPPGTDYALHQRARLLYRIITLHQSRELATTYLSSADIEDLPAIERALYGLQHQWQALTHPMDVVTGHVELDHPWSPDDLRARIGEDVVMLIRWAGEGPIWTRGQIADVLHAPPRTVTTIETSVILRTDHEHTEIPAHRILWVMNPYSPHERAACDAIPSQHPLTRQRHTRGQHRR